MTCREIEDRIEMVASGDEPATDAFRAHVEGCIRCAAALATARRIHEVIESRPAPPAPPRFTATVLAQLRHERWRSEQQVDRLFNLALAVGVVAIVGGLVALFNIGGVIDAVGGATAALTRVVRESGRQAAPALSTYLLAGGLLGFTLAVWWLAERRPRAERRAA